MRQPAHQSHPQTPHSTAPTALPTPSPEMEKFIGELAEMMERFAQQDFTGNHITLTLRNGGNREGVATGLKCAADGTWKLELTRVHNIDVAAISSVSYYNRQGKLESIRYQGLES